MSERITEILVNETVDTLEKLAFVFAEPEDDPDAFDAADMITVRTDFTGPFTGSLVIEFAEAGLGELAANMLGLDEDDEITREEQRDALKEALNIICGNVLPAIAGSEAIFNIAPPQLTEGPFNGDAEAAKAVARFTLDEGFVILYLLCDGQLPE